MIETNNKTEILKIGTTEVILIYGPAIGQGKIIINDNQYNIRASYFWGAMGCDLVDFILTLDEGYFITKLGGTLNFSGSSSIDIKSTMANVREFVRKECPSKWYSDIEFHKELRKELNTIQNNSYSGQGFVNEMENLKYKFHFPYNHREYDNKDTIEMLANEPWHFIVNSIPLDHIWLGKFLPRLKKKLLKIKKETFKN